MCSHTLLREFAVANCFRHVAQESIPSSCAREPSTLEPGLDNLIFFLSSLRWRLPPRVALPLSAVFALPHSSRDAADAADAADDMDDEDSLRRFGYPFSRSLRACTTIASASCRACDEQLSRAPGPVQSPLRIWGRFCFAGRRRARTTHHAPITNAPTHHALRISASGTNNGTFDGQLYPTILATWHATMQEIWV
jgi:hypothetical protein